MPTELALLPMVESAFNPMAYSRAHASGLWQFIPSTGKQYNLEQNWWYDARRDIIASTSAALDYLQFLYQLHGDWHLALASYNWGENAVLRAVQRNRDRGLPTDYASLDMPGETRNYVPKLQALKNIVANPSAFGVDLAPIPNAEYFVTVTLTRDIDLRVAAKLAEMNIDELIALNPGHNRPVVSIAVAPQLVLPADRAEAFVRNLRQNDRPLSSWTTYTFKAGDRLEKIAVDHGTTLAKLQAANGLGPRSKLQPGQQLLVPVRGSAAAADPLPRVFAQTAAGPRRITYVVKRGDTVYGVARVLGVSQQDVRQAAGSKLIAGHTITITTAGAPPAKPSRSAAVKAPPKGPVAKPAPARPAPSPTQLARPSSAS
jgi:membrane-bound lytic murein transglycosylase D